MTARGIRGNNPGNIEKGQPWRGLAAEQPDARFATFVAPVYGIRAIVKILLTYQRRDPNLTIRKIINAWAPPVENDTESYVNHVARACDMPPDGIIPGGLRAQPGMTREIVKAIIRHENGTQPYGENLIADAVTLAFNS